MLTRARSAVAVAAATTTLLVGTATPAFSWALAVSGPPGSAVPVHNIGGSGDFRFVSLAVGDLVTCHDVDVSGFAYRGGTNPAISLTTVTFGGTTYFGDPNYCEFTAAYSVGTRVTIGGALSFNVSNATPIFAEGRLTSPGTSGLRFTLQAFDGCTAVIGSSSAAGFQTAAFVNATDLLKTEATYPANLSVLSATASCDPAAIQQGDQIRMAGGWTLSADITISP